MEADLTAQDQAATIPEDDNIAAGSIKNDHAGNEHEAAPQPEEQAPEPSTNQQERLDTAVAELVVQTDDVNDAITGAPPSTERTDELAPPRKQAWAKVLPAKPAYPNMFEFLPPPEPVCPVLPELPVTPVSPKEEDPDHAVSTMDVVVREPRHVRILDALNGDHHDGISVHVGALQDNEHQQLRLGSVENAEKSYVAPTELPSFGWMDVYHLGLSLTYTVILLRRDISARSLIMNEDVTSSSSPRLPTLTASACHVLATAGIAFNHSTEELFIRQRSLLPTKRSSKTNAVRKHLTVKPMRYSPRKKAGPRPCHQSSCSPNANASPTVCQRVTTRLGDSHSRNRINDVGAIALFRALRINTSLRSVALECAGISDRCSFALAAMLRCNSSLTSLSLQGNAIGPEGTRVLCDALEDCADSVLIHLNLGHNRITDQGVAHLCRALTENETLVWLDLSWNRLSSSSVLALLSALRANFVLSAISLHGKDIDDDQYCLNLEARFAPEFAAALRQLNPCLSEVCVSSAQAVLPVDKMKYSRWLALPSRGLVELDALIISGLVPLNTRLLTLDLSHNPGIERWGILELLRAIRHCPSLRRVNLTETGLYEEVSPLVGELVASNQTLEVIIMHGDELWVQQICGRVTSVETLTFAIPTSHFLDRWILAKALALNRVTQHLNALHVPPPISVLSGHPPVVHVNYSGRGMQLFEVVFLAKKIFHHLHLGRVALNGCGIDSDGGLALADAIRNHASLESLELENNTLSERGGRALVECVEFNSSLTVLNLSWNQMGDAGVLGLARALKANRALRCLDLRGNALSAAGIGAISEGLAGNACLQDLYLRWNTICATGARALARALIQNKALRLLDITHHTMGPKSALVLADMLVANNCLQELHMNGDEAVLDGEAIGVGAAAAQRIALALAHSNRCLRVFHVAQNGMGREGIEPFATVLKCNPTLRVLDLSYAHLDSKRALRFFECLGMNRGIIKLSLAYNRIGNEGMRACNHALERNRVLEELDVAHNGITEEPLAFLLGRFRARPQLFTLKELCLTGNTMIESTQSGFLALAPRLVVVLEDQQHHRNTTP